MKTLLLLVVRTNSTVTEEMVEELKRYIGYMNILEDTDEKIPGCGYHSIFTKDNKQDIQAYMCNSFPDENITVLFIEHNPSDMLETEYLSLVPIF